MKSKHSGKFVLKRVRAACNGVTYDTFRLSGWLNGRRIRRQFKDRDEALGEKNRLEIEAANKGEIQSPPHAFVGGPACRGRSRNDPPWPAVPVPRRRLVSDHLQATRRSRCHRYSRHCLSRRKVSACQGNSPRRLPEDAGMAEGGVPRRAPFTASRQPTSKASWPIAV
jgi:hypothetical protein